MRAGPSPFVTCAITERVFAPDARVISHSHPVPALGIVAAGGLTHIVGRHERTCDRFAVVIKPAGQPHSTCIHRSGARGFFIEMSARVATTLGPAGRVLDEPRKLEGEVIHSLAARICAELRLGDEFTPVAVDGLILDLLAEGGRHLRRVDAGREPAWMVRVDDFVRSHVARPPSLADMARVAGVSTSQVCRGFRRHRGVSIGEFVRMLRIERAASQLTAGMMPLAEIAAAAGFCDQSHFSRTFRRHTGMSPSAFRARMRR